MAGNDQFKCDKCNALVDANKCTLIKTLPNFLSVHLRRFKYDEIKKGMTKLTWQIPFSPKIIMKPNYNGKDEKSVVYKLVGVVAHLGSG